MANIVKINGKYVKDITARDEITNLASQTGELTNLNTTAKNNLVAAINEVAQSDVSTLQTALSAYPMSTVSGSVVSITDGADGLPVKALTVDIVPAQSGSGVPSPSNVRNIIGKSSAIVYVGGANLYNSSQNVHGTFGTDGAVVESDSATTEITDFIPVNDAFTVRGHIYTSQGSYPRETVMACIYDENKVFVREYGIYYKSDGDGSFRLPLNSGEKYVRYTITANNISNSEYQMYSENIYQINWSDEAGTICDGTLDVTNGVLTVNRVMITLDGSETWSMNGSNESGFICNAPVPISKLSANSNTSNIVSNMFTIVGNSSVANPSTTTTGIPSGGGSPLLVYFYLRYDFMADIEAWKTWLATHNTQVSYLIEPRSYQLDPIEVLTLLGENTIYTNCGDVSVTYHADPTLHSAAIKDMLSINDAGDIEYDDNDTYASGTVGAGIADLKNKTPFVATPEETEADLYIADPQGNVLAEFADGHIKTKKFNSDDVPPAIETFSVQKTYVRGLTNTLTVQGPFEQGDEIYFHLADGNRYDSYGRYATYYEGNTVIANNRRGSNGYYRHIVTADCATVGLSIGSTEYTDGTELTLYVYRKHRDVEPTVITVKTDGTGMFTTLKAAVDSITDANHLTKPYVIEVYPGSYDCLEGYTDEEIASADTSGDYTQDSMVGIKLTDGMSIRGIGRCDDIILTAELDATKWSSAVRGQISTLNIEGEGNIENLTIVGKHIRYCVHDDFLSPVNSHDKRVLRNLKFHGEYLSYYPLFTTYGAGMSAPRDYLIENCDFGYDLGIHSNGGYQFGCTIEINNCSGNRYRIGDSATSDSDAVNRVIVNNCNFRMLKFNHNTSTPHMALEGVGNEQSMIEDPLMSMYRLGMIDRIPLGIADGKLVCMNGLTCEVTSNKSVAYGVVIGSDTNYCYVQKCGYIPLNYLNITNVSVGDYLTVDNAGSVITGGTVDNAVAVVKSVDSITAFAELII